MPGLEPPRLTFVDISGQFFNLIHANDVSFYDEVVPVVQEEPLEAIDPGETRGLLAAIGIQKGKPFAPDERMRRILSEAAAVQRQRAHALGLNTRDRDAYVYPNSAWQTVWFGNNHLFSPGGVLNLDARAMFFYMGVGVSPAMTVKMVGRGSQYVIAYHDAAPAPRQQRPTGCTCLHSG